MCGSMAVDVAAMMMYPPTANQVGIWSLRKKRVRRWSSYDCFGLYGEAVGSSSMVNDPLEEVPRSCTNSPESVRLRTLQKLYKPSPRIIATAMNT